MESAKKAPYKAHCLVLAYPSQGHINPLIQFSKRLEFKGLKVTLVNARSISRKIHEASSSSIAFETISDGYDEGGIAQAESIKAYLDRFRQVGQETLIELIEKMNNTAYPVDCIVYDSFLPWALDVVKKFGLVGAVFLTQSCAVDSIYYHAQQGWLKLPLTSNEIYSLPGLPPYKPLDMPSFIYDLKAYPAVFDLVVTSQFSNIHKADWILANTFHELEKDVVDWLAKIWPLRTIGPTIPAMYLDKQLQDDKVYGFSIFEPNSDASMKWLNDRAVGSVVYVSFGSLAEIQVEQMEEVAWALKGSDHKYFLWVVRASEVAKLPKGFVEETSTKGLIVSWCPQLQVLAHEAIGCFVTHCGWNSTLEALSLGVPMVAMPQWTDQTTNAKHIMDVWKMGLRVPVDKNGNIARKEAIKHCIKEILEGETSGKEIRENAIKWKKLAKEAMAQGGSSDQHIDEFVANFVSSKSE